MNRYIVTYHDKTYIQYAHDAGEAIKKFSNRCVFGRRIIFDYRICIIDADTCGEIYARAWTRGEDFERCVEASLEG